jgi:uncharacterized membrane protein
MDKMPPVVALVFVAAIGSGLVCGISSFVMAALGRIPPAQGVAAMNSNNVTVNNPSFMTAFIGTGVLCVVIGVGSLFMWNHADARIAFGASLVYLLGCIGRTMILNVPLNEKLASIADPATAIAFWPQIISNCESNGTMVGADASRPEPRATQYSATVSN